MPAPPNEDADRRADLDRSVRAGGRAVAAAQVASQVISLVVLAVLLRLLGPEPFGLLAMVLPLLLLGRTFTAFGLNVAAVQRETLSREEASSLLWWTLVLGLLTTVLLVALAAPVAWFYDQQELSSLTVVLAATALVFAVGVQQQARLERHLQLGSLAFARVASQTFGGVLAIGYAWMAGAESHYGGVWTLVVQQYAELILLAIVAWGIDPWRPCAPVRGAAVQDMFRFGRQYTASGLFFTLGQQLDKVVIGVLLGDRALGLYSQAFNIIMKPVTLISTAITGVMLPALSRARADRTVFEELLLAFNRLVAITLLPAGVGLMIVGPEVMTVLGGGQWQAAGPLLATLAAVVLVQGFINIAGSAFASVGQSRRLMFGAAGLTLGSLLGLLAAWAVSSSMDDRLLGVTAGYVFTLVVVLFPPYLVYCMRSVDVSPGQWLRAIRRPAIAAGLMGLIVLGGKLLLVWTTSFGDAATLAVLIPLGAIVYIWLAREEVRWIVQRWGRDA